MRERRWRLKVARGNATRYARGIMRLIYVNPIIRGGSRDELAYFSALDATVGSTVIVPIRAKVVRALVVATEEISDKKISVKRSDFQIRKLPRQKPVQLLLPAFIEAARHTALYHATNLGAVLYGLTSNAILARTESVGVRMEKASPPQTKNQKLVFQATYDERLVTYRSLIRGEFARNKSVFLTVPTITDGEWLADSLCRGIEPYTILLHSSLSKVELFARFDLAVKTAHPVLIIATGLFLSLPRTDIGTIIVERENSPVYRSQERPYLDVRIAAEELSSSLHARFILADLPLSVETLHRYRSGNLDELSPLKSRPMFVSTASIADMRGKRDAKEKFEIVGAELNALITRALKEKQKVLLFCSRRGIAPISVCQDCKATVQCQKCSAPASLHKAPPGSPTGENVFICHRCKTIRSAKERCSVCRSWKLISLGIGIDRVVEELKHLYPDIPLLRLDRDTIKTHAQANGVIKKFYMEKGGVLLGTELALHYLHLPVEVSAVVSLDSLLSVPQWRVAEKVFSLLMTLRLLTKGTCLVQTRRPDDYIIRATMSGSIADFYSAELKLRAQFHYPPFFVIIKILCHSPRLQALAEFERLRSRLFPHEFELFEFRGALRHKASACALMRIPQGAWPDMALSTLLASLPPQFSVSVNPENMLQ